MIALLNARTLRHPRANVVALTLALLGALLCCVPAHAQISSAEVVKVRAVAQRTKVIPGDSLAIAVEFTISPPWHTWTSESQSDALPPEFSKFDGAIFTEISAQAEPAKAVDVHVDRIQWPTIHSVDGDLGAGPGKFAVYEGTAIAYVPVVVKGDAAAGPLTIRLKVSFQACNDHECKGPADVELPVTLEVAPGEVGTSNEPTLFAGFQPAVLATLGAHATKLLKFPFFGWDFALDENGDWFFPLLLVLAFIGGALLNFTPCVLPIIPLKIMGLSAAAAGERHRTFMLGLAMSAGVVLFWGVLAVLISSVQLIKSTNELFQYPGFTIGVGVFIAIMAVAMSGFFTIGLPQWVYAIEPKHETYGGSIIFGVMTAVLSTPCTGPFMGAASGWAVANNKGPGTIIAVFLVIGAGMAAPYLLLSMFPQLARKMPKTGPASEVMKQVMGLLLLAAGVYFIGSGLNGFLVEPSNTYWWVVGSISVAAGLWLAWRTLRVARTAVLRTLFVVVGLGIATAGAYTSWWMTFEVLPWSRFSDAAMKAAMKEGKVVVVDFTADWCLICKFLEKSVLEPANVSDVLKESDVVLLKADVVKGHKGDIEALQTKFQHPSIPFLLIFAPDGTNTLASEAYTQGQVLEAVRAARKK